MFTLELEINLHAIAIEIPDNYDEPDLMDIEGLCVPFDEYDYDTMNSVVDHEALDGETFCIGE